MLNRRLTSAFIIALVVAGVSTLWLSQKFTKTHVAPPPPRSQYVTAAANLEAGQLLRPENLRLADWPATMPLQGAYINMQPLVGRVVLYPLAAGEPILERQLSTPGTSNGITVKIPDGMRAIALRTDEVVGVAGFLLPGTHVDVLVTLHPSTSPDPITTTVLQDAQVLAAGQKTEPDPDGKPATATVVTILVSPKDAERVDLAATQGTVHFVLRNGADRLQVKGTPVLLSELSGLPTTIAPVKSGSGPVRSAPKPYIVETFMGPTVKTENFQ
ncbi:MAG: Flp pilus assembly protein CpaB [Acidobacteriota bacterium]|nr:Flp pilus assembly protein CpaB [Acidobacteriota bacterium]